MAEVIEEETTNESEEVRKMLVLFSPEAWIVLPFAITLDILGFVFLILDIAYGVGEILSWISDGAGIIVLGAWLLIRAIFVSQTTTPKELTGKVIEKRKATKKAVRIAKKGGGRGLKFALSVVGEVLPIVGGLPFWTWFVWTELRR